MRLTCKGGKYAVSHSYLIPYFIISNKQVNLLCSIIDNPPHYSRSRTPLSILSISKIVIKLHQLHLMPLVKMRNKFVDVLIFEVRVKVAWQQDLEVAVWVRAPADSIGDIVVVVVLIVDQVVVLEELIAKVVGGVVRSSSKTGDC
jgi:hypothetical protein